MAKQFAIVIDASANVNRDRRYAVNGICRTWLNSMLSDQEFALVAFNRGLSGFESGRFRPLKEAPQALEWLSRLEYQGQADFGVLFRRLICLSGEVQVLLLASGPLGSDSELFRIAELGPPSLTLWALALDGDPSRLRTLCRVLRGDAFACDSLEYQRALGRIPSSAGRR